MTNDFNFRQFDADSHIQETGGSWEMYLDNEFESRRPAVIDNPYVSERPHRNKTWYIDGRLIPKNQGSGAVVMSTPCEMEFGMTKPIPLEVQACTSPVDRANLMREMGIDRTVLYSTLFLETLTDDLIYEAALMHSWNIWMSETCKQDKDMLRFAALVPIRDPFLALQEMQKARELGADAVMILPTAGERWLHDRIFDPFWAEAVNLKMPVAVHIGWPAHRVTQECTTPSTIFLGAFDTSVWWAYISVFTGGIFDRFPQLKLAFLEHDARFFELFLYRAMHWWPTEACKPWPSNKSPKDVLNDHQIYFSFEGDYDYLPHFTKFVGEDRVMGAFDFPHTHYGVASLSAAFDFIRNHGNLSSETKRKLLHDNAASFYGWND